MNILLTGAFGFLGQAILDHLNFPVNSLGRSGCDINCDLSRYVPVLQHPNLVIHAAGKAHFRPKNDLERKEFYAVNVTGTKNLLRGLEKGGIPKRLVFISSVSVYGREEGCLIDESHSLEANDAYGESKILAEEIVTKWCHENNVISTIFRLPLLVGPNPPGNLGSMIKGIKKGYYFNIAGGKSKKSMVLAEDVAKIVLPASKIGGIYNLTDGYHPSFKELSDHIAFLTNKNRPANIPKWIAKVLAKTGDILGPKFPFNSYKLSKITSDLTFSDLKARETLGWAPQLVLKGMKL